MTELPGETWEDIFHEAAVAGDYPTGHNARRMTGSDWDAILGRTRSTETKGEPEQ